MDEVEFEKSLASSYGPINSGLLSKWLWEGNFDECTLNIENLSKVLSKVENLDPDYEKGRLLQLLTTLTTVNDPRFKYMSVTLPDNSNLYYVNLVTAKSLCRRLDPATNIPAILESMILFTKNHKISKSVKTKPVAVEYPIGAHIYIHSDDPVKGPFKIGFASNLKARGKDYKTISNQKGFKFLYYRRCDAGESAEKAVHTIMRKYKVHHHGEHYDLAYNVCKVIVDKVCQAYDDIDLICSINEKNVDSDSVEEDAIESEPETKCDPEIKPGTEPELKTDTERDTELDTERDTEREVKKDKGKGKVRQVDCATNCDCNGTSTNCTNCTNCDCEENCRCDTKQLRRKSTIFGRNFLETYRFNRKKSFTPTPLP